MKKWQVTLCCVVMCFWSKSSRGQELTLLPGKNILSIIPEFWGQSPTPTAGSIIPDITTKSNIPATLGMKHADMTEVLGAKHVDMPKVLGAKYVDMPEVLGAKHVDIPEVMTMKQGDILTLEQDQVLSESLEMTTLDTFAYDPITDQADLHSVIHAGLPLGLAVTPLLQDGKHELVFNVTWMPSLGPPAEDYSLEVTSETETEDCRSRICYEYNIPGESLWHIIPRESSPVAETCTFHPGCEYKVRLIAHPWDGHTSANINVQLDECVAGVCSCAHAPRLPTPVVQAHTLSINGQIVTNITWSLPPPSFPLRLPKGLQKKLYFVSISKQMVSDAHPSPWYGYTAKREVAVDGPVAAGDDVRWAIVPIDERSDRRSGVQGRYIVLDVKLLARVSLVDDRGCIGPAGNATAYDPAEAHKTRIGTYALWAAFGGTCVLAMVAILAVSARAVKRVLNALRPAPVSAPLEPLRRRPAWLPLQLRG